MTLLSTISTLWCNYLFLILWFIVMMLFLHFILINIECSWEIHFYSIKDINGIKSTVCFVLKLIFHMNRFFISRIIEIKLFAILSCSLCIVFKNNIHFIIFCLGTKLSFWRTLIHHKNKGFEEFNLIFVWISFFVRIMLSVRSWTLLIAVLLQIQIDVFWFGILLFNLTSNFEYNDYPSRAWFTM